MPIQIGSHPDGLTVTFVKGDPFTATIRLRVKVDENTFEYVAFPAAPVLVIGSTTWTAALSAAGGVDGARATWSKSASDVAALGSGGEAQIRVNGVTWWKGVAYDV